MAWTLTRADTGETHVLDQRPVYSAADRAWSTDLLTFGDLTGEEWTLIAPTTPWLNVPAFMMRFHPNERLAIRASQDPVIVDFLRLVDDPRVQNVDLAHPSVQGAVMYMALSVSPPLVQSERVAEILAPEPVE